MSGSWGSDEFPCAGGRRGALTHAERVEQLNKALLLFSENGRQDALKIHWVHFESSSPLLCF
jgi:hypothetical protein